MMWSSPWGRARGVRVPSVLRVAAGRSPVDLSRCSFRSRDLYSIITLFCLFLLRDAL